MKNDHKLIMENWRKFTSEEEQEQLDEGVKEFLLGAAMMLAPGLANALTVDGHELKTVSTQLQADGSEEAKEIANKIVDALKKKNDEGKPTADIDNDNDLNISELGLDFNQSQAFDKIMDQSPSAKPSPEKQFDVAGAVKKANQKTSDKFSDKLGVPRDYTGTGT